MFANRNGRRIAMRVWLYSRLSRDEDDELNSLKNQQNIIREYAEKNCYTIVGESFDDNVSGMHFNREGINKIYEAVESKLIDAVIVKDMSRLGRHKTQTALFIDYLRENDVKVLSVTENLDTSNENDDLIIGFKGLFNDMYARDISRKVRAGIEQKQKTTGLICQVPMGYYKDKNTGELIIMDEQAEIVRKIFQLYLDGYGLKNIAHILNENGDKPPRYYQLKYNNKKIGINKPEITYRFLWEGTAVKRILQNEFYAGTLVNHISYTNKNNHVRKSLPHEEYIRHENAVPPLISMDDFQKVQQLLERKKKENVRASQKPFHRYTGLIKCGDCGSIFTCKTRYWKGKPPRYEYVCNSYHRYGVENCTSHRINESTLDCLVYDELRNILSYATKQFESIDVQMKKWLRQKGSTKQSISVLKEQLSQRKTDQQNILLEKIRDPQRAEIYTQMLENCETDIDKLSKQISELENIGDTIKSRKAEIKSSIDVMQRIIDEGAISNTDLRMLIDQIMIFEVDGKLDVKITFNGKFRKHIDIYDNGNITDRTMEHW